MRSTVTELLRNFPKIRRAVLAGERVVIDTRDGELVLTANKPAAGGLFGALHLAIDSKELTEQDSGANTADWSPSL
jgi:hypothetical protein